MVSIIRAGLRALVSESCLNHINHDKGENMVYAKMDNDGKVTEQRIIEQSEMTADCWLIQIEGLKACEGCVAKGSDECGGGQTLIRLRRAGK